MKPPNISLEPTRPRSCAIMSPMRAAQTARWPDKGHLIFEGRTMESNWRSLSDDQQSELDGVARPSGWRVVRGSDLPSVFPDSLRAKVDSAVIVSAPTSSGGTYLVYSANRVDEKTRQIDIQPFGLIVHSSGPGSSGVFLQHGKWDGRSESPPAGFWESVQVSGIGDYLYANPPQGMREGTLDQLPRGRRGAFDATVREIRARVDGRKE